MALRPGCSCSVPSARHPCQAGGLLANGYQAITAMEQGQLCGLGGIRGTSLPAVTLQSMSAFPPFLLLTCADVQIFLVPETWHVTLSRCQLCRCTNTDITSPLQLVFLLSCHTDKAVSILGCEPTHHFCPGPQQSPPVSAFLCRQEFSLCLGPW